METFGIRRARASDRDDLAVMRNSLWPQTSIDAHRQELDAVLGGKSVSSLPFVILVSESEGGVLQGFIEVGLRSHADGCDTSRPVGYVEGWFVRDALQHRGIGTALMRAAEEWACSHGCVEMASDALIENALSERAHLALGFEVVDRCVNFRKTLALAVKTENAGAGG
jgi:aminoglycoside 6'-N-acetyltransferase I